LQITVYPLKYHFLYFKLFVCPGIYANKHKYLYKKIFLFLILYTLLDLSTYYNTSKMVQGKYFMLAALIFGARPKKDRRGWRGRAQCALHNEILCMRESHNYTILFRLQIARKALDINSGIYSWVKYKNLEPCGLHILTLNLFRA
jgi:hypothetical protein